MNGLFASLYFDEDVSARVAEMISARGFDVPTTFASSNLGAPDPYLLQYATRNQRVFFTHNRRDFEALANEYFDRGLTHAGIIIAVRRPPREITTRLLAILNKNTADEFQGQILYL